MSRKALIDANVPVYAGGRPHPLKTPCVEVLSLAAEHPEAFITDAEVLQELLHRYLALDLRAAGGAIFDAFLTLMRGRIVGVCEEDLVGAKQLASDAPSVSARDLVHAAVMRRVACARVVSADKDFDRLRGVTRLDPARVREWAGEFTG